MCKNVTVNTYINQDPTETYSSFRVFSPTIHQMYWGTN